MAQFGNTKRHKPVKLTGPGEGTYGVVKAHIPPGFLQDEIARAGQCYFQNGKHVIP